MHPELSFGHWLRIRRKALDLTREGLADRVGCSAATIRKLEAEERRPSAQIAERLADIFGIPPGERDPFLRFARGEARASPAEPEIAAPWQTPAAPANLPTPANALIGREKELGAALAHLRDPDIRLTTLIGPPGIGKTRLSIEIARKALADFPDGVWFTDLALLDDPALVAPAILQSLGYRPAKGLPAEKELAVSILDRRILLVLDNCEHLIARTAELALDLLSACPHLKILAASREALRVPGEWILVVPPLAGPPDAARIDPEAVAEFPALSLFAARARAVQSDFILTADNLPAVAAICAQLDGLPLAIELVAARVQVMSPHRLLERLGGQFTLSADGRRAVPARQKTLEQAIRLSFDLLTPAEQRLFTGLSVFSGGFSLQAAESCFGGDMDSDSFLATLHSLLNKSLLQRKAAGRDEIRFGMLITIRQFAQSELRHMGAEADARNRHLDYFLALAESGEAGIRGAEQAQWADRLESEFDNFNAALEWCAEDKRALPALRLLGALGWPWEVRGHYLEAHRWLGLIRSLPDASAHPLMLARALNHIGRHCWTQENAREARALLEESREICLRAGPGGEQALIDTLNWLVLIRLFFDQDGDQARALSEQAQALAEKLQDRRGQALSIFHRGIVEAHGSRAEIARTLLESSLALFRQFGDLFFIARNSLFLGQLFLKQGDYDNARVFLEERLKLDQQILFWDGIADGWLDLAGLYQQQGAAEEAWRCFEESVAVCEAHGLRKFGAYYQSGLLALQNKEFTLAARRFLHPLALAQKSGNTEHTGLLMAGLAAVAGETGQHRRAAMLSGAAEVKLEMEANLEAWGLFEPRIAAARQALGDAAFESLRAAGHAMPLQQAIVLALENPSQESSPARSGR